MNEGIVYVLTNPAMPKLVKIGKTGRGVETRLNDLYTTGVPLGMLRALEADTKKGRGIAEAQFLESYDGDGCTSLRVGKNGTGEMRSYSSCHVSLFCGVQDEVLRELINGSDASGKFARLNMVKCPLRPLKLKDDPITLEEQKAYEKAEHSLTFWARKLYELRPQTYQLSLKLAGISTAGFMLTSWRLCGHQRRR